MIDVQTSIVYKQMDQTQVIPMVLVSDAEKKTTELKNSLQLK